MTYHRYTIEERPEALAVCPDPIDIIVTGYSGDQAWLVGADRSESYSNQPCMFVDCDDTVYYAERQYLAAIDLYFLRSERVTHTDDSILVCCRRHRHAINNAPSVVGIDIYAARAAVAS